MISRAEYLYKKSKITEYENTLFDYENDPVKHPDYAAWTRFQSLDVFGQNKLREEWDSYYAACRVSYHGLIFDLAKIAFNTHDYGLLKSLIEQGKNTKAKPVPKPSSFDPSELERKMHTYFEFRHMVTQLKAEIGEYEPVYEPKKEPVRDTIEF